MSNRPGHIGKWIKTIISFTVLGTVILSGMILSYKDHAIDVFPTEETKIRIYGEYHGAETYYDTEYKLWKGYYDEGYRDLFIELPYYTAEFINVWMNENDNEIIDQVFEDLQGSAAGNEYYYRFFEEIKNSCPETVFHGTDIGHQFESTGIRYLDYLEETGKKDSPEYEKTIKCIRQGMEVYSDNNVYTGLSPLRENYLVENFTEAYDLTGGKVMGIYGSDHTRSDKPEYLYGRLREHYAGKVSTVRISTIIFGENQPYKTGFSVTGLVILLLIFIPKILHDKSVKTEDNKKQAKEKNRVLLILELVGEVAVTLSLLMFKSVDPHITITPEGVYFDWILILWIAAFVLLILYECYWTRYLIKKKNEKDLYSSFAGYPVAGATLPAIAVLLTGIYSGNLVLIAVSIIFGTGFIGNHVMRKQIFLI